MQHDVLNYLSLDAIRPGQIWGDQIRDSTHPLKIRIYDEGILDSIRDVEIIDDQSVILHLQ